MERSAAQYARQLNNELRANLQEGHVALLYCEKQSFWSRFGIETEAQLAAHIADTGRLEREGAAKEAAAMAASKATPVGLTHNPFAALLG